nr:HesA/MoeB/ThiF family protein [Halorhodospira abdelmalekii]
MLRYSRQILLPHIDLAGQQRLLASSALIVGAGGLGSPAALYLAGAGVGHLYIADGDTVELGNLQRQIAHTTERLGQPKARSAQIAAQQLNPTIAVTPLPALTETATIAEHARTVDVVLDCSDNFATRFAVNEACIASRRPLVSAAVLRWELQLTTIPAGGSPCYRCLFGAGARSDESCSDSGIIAPLPGVGGSLQAIEAIKVLTGAGAPLYGRLLTMDVLQLSVRTIRLPADPECPVCASEPRARAGIVSG